MLYIGILFSVTNQSTTSQGGGGGTPELSDPIHKLPAGPRVEVFTEGTSRQGTRQVLGHHVPRGIARPLGKALMGFGLSLWGAWQAAFPQGRTPRGPAALLQNHRQNTKYSGKDKRGGSASSLFMVPQRHGRWHCLCVFTRSEMFNYRPINSRVYVLRSDALSSWWENK